VCIDYNLKIGCCKTVGEMRTVPKIYPSGTEVNRESEFSAHEPKEETTAAGRTLAKDLNVMCGCCCYIESLFCKFPDAFGAEQSTSCLCCADQLLCCKPMVYRGEVFQGEVCALCDQRTTCVVPRTCCSCVSQCFVCDRRSSFPCDAKGDVPCILNVCFINCCYNWNCACGETYCHTLDKVIKSQQQH